MKKVSLLIALIAFAFGNAFAQMSYDFSDGTAGAKIAQTYGEPWTTWSEAPGGAEDGVFGEIGGSMAAHFTYGNDQILKFGNLTTGAWTLTFDMYIPTGKDAYNNVLHAFAGSGSEWCTEVFYNSSEYGTTIKAAGLTTTFTFPFDTWFNVRYELDLDNDLASFFINDTEIVSWQFSAQASGDAGTRQLAAADFFPPTSAAVSEYYIDNLTFDAVSNEEVIVDDDFEEYTVGNKIAVESQAAGHDWWTTWSNTPGSAEDGVVATQGTKTGHFTYDNDQVLLLGDAESAQYIASFDMYIPNGKDAYNNILHIFAGSGSEWGVEVNYKKSDGTYIEVAGGQTTFECPYDEWFNVRYDIDLDNDLATFYVDDVEIVSWQFSLKTDGSQGTRRLAAIDFFPPTSASASEYYIDNVLVLKNGGASAAHMAVEPEEISERLGEDDMTTVDITITNSGNSIGDWLGWVEFGEGGTGTQTAELAWHNGENGSNIGSSSAVTREMAIRLPATAYAGTAMGMKAISASYFINTEYQSTDHNYIFRLYGPGLNGQPGELLAEKSVSSTAAGQWITATFDDPVYLTGETIWATVQLEQAASEYPLSMDSSVIGEIQDGNWLGTNGGSFSHCYSAGSFEGAWMITVNCQGEKIPGTWASLNKESGSILGGASEDVVLSLNTVGVAEGTYTASVIILTSDEQNPEIVIPLTLIADYDAVIENAANAFNVYPNPTTGMVTVEGENIAAIAIYNAAGQLIKVVNTTTVDMSVLGTGVYFLNIVDNANNTTVQRVVVK